MTAVNTTLYGKSGGTTVELNPKSIGTQIIMNDKSGAASNVDAEIVALRSSISALSSAIIFKGTVSSSSGLPTSGYKAGWEYVVAEEGTYAGKKCEVGDAILCVNSYVSAASDNDWVVLQANLDGVVKGPASSVTGNVAFFDGTTGKVIKDSGISVKKSVPADAQFTDTTYNDASTTEHGLMSTTDKTKLDGLETLPTKVADKFLKVNSAGTALEWGSSSVGIASTTATGVVMVGDNLTINSTTGKLDATDTTYSDATTTVAGLMSTADKTKLDTIDSFPTKVSDKYLKVKSDGSGLEWGSPSGYTLPIAKADTLGGVKVGTNLTINATTGVLDATDTTYSAATTSADGLMSKDDKTKLDGVATGAEVNQNAVNTIKVGTVSVAATGKTDTIELTAGDGITLTGNATDKKIEIEETYIDSCIVAKLDDVPSNLRDGGLIILKS